ncbi:MAG: hypothetical protein GY832_21320, partial [Chloroflexi bacterium]|nr:hypothetical protein [Chloroflexota bacterium]
MPHPKFRDPSSFAGAVTIIVRALGHDTCAKLVDKTEALVRMWSDPDHDSFPNVKQALKLDKAYQDAGLGPGPISKWMNSCLGEAELTNIADPVSEHLDVVAVVGKISTGLQEIKSISSEGGRAITPNEMLQMLQQIDDLRKQTDELDAAIRRAATTAPLTVVQGER